MAFPVVKCINFQFLIIKVNLQMTTFNFQFVITCSLMVIIQSLTEKYWCDDEAFRTLQCIKCTQILCHGVHKLNAIIKHAKNLKSCYTYLLIKWFKLFTTYPCSLNFQENCSLKWFLPHCQFTAQLYVEIMALAMSNHNTETIWPLLFKIKVLVNT